MDRTFILEELPKLNMAELRVLLVLALHHSVERGCWPTVSTISNLSGLHRVTVHKALNSLQEKALIAVEDNRGEYPGGQRCFGLPVDDHNVLVGGPVKWSVSDEAPGMVRPLQEDV